MVSEQVNNVQVTSEIDIKMDPEQIYSWFQFKFKNSKICECISQRSKAGGTEKIVDLDLF